MIMDEQTSNRKYKIYLAVLGLLLLVLLFWLFIQRSQLMKLVRDKEVQTAGLQHDLDSLMDAEMDVHHEESGKPASALQKVGDALPGIGIVAAVLGIVVTMAAISGPVEVIGEKVAAALTGTFLGVLLAYGFFGPLSTAIENINSEEARFFAFFKASVIAFAKGFAPIVAVEFARRAIFSTARPTFQEMEAACKQAAKAGK